MQRYIIFIGERQVKKSKYQTELQTDITSIPFINITEKRQRCLYHKIISPLLFFILFWLTLFWKKWLQICLININDWHKCCMNIRRSFGSMSNFLMTYSVGLDVNWSNFSSFLFFFPISLRIMYLYIEIHTKLIISALLPRRRIDLTTLYCFTLI